MDEYYTLKFFAYADLGRDIVEDLQEFACPQHYDTIDDARLVAEYWMGRNMFDCVRCDEYCEDSNVMGNYDLRKSGVFIGQNVYGKIVWSERK